ncbi:MAG: 2-C-methyl-D-erythritol 4-phosphate cytidylyltransferase [Verrucomicrobiae bacterium]|nr:2-C-methyl-D-erythritol 4-phosphate cytidylyltransferase [Verrucomicrobiae bacterium]
MVTAIVLAAGRSSRMGGTTNKQFLQLLGKPVLWYSLAACEECPAVNAVVLVRRPDEAETAEKLRQNFSKIIAVADGGPERQNSVWNGLEKCPPTTQIVAVHDGARPLVTPALFEATVLSAQQHGTGIAATKIVDTIKEADQHRIVIRTVDRTRLWAVQTPQTVRHELLRRAYAEVFRAGIVVTDEAAAVERLGLPVHLVETPFLNLKLTTPADLPILAALLRARNRPARANPSPTNRTKTKP